MIKFIKVLVLVLISLGVLSGTVSAVEIEIRSVLLNDNGEKNVFSTREETVGDFLTKEGIVLSDIDSMNVSPEDLLSPNTSNQIVIYRGYDVKVIIDGEEEEIAVEDGLRIGNLVARIKNERDMEFTCEENLDTIMTSGQVIHLSTEVEETVSETIEMPFEIIVKLDEELEKDKTEMIQQGENGEKTIISKIVSVAGKEVYREVVSEEVVKEPINTIVRRGTKEVVEKELGKTVDVAKLKYKKSIVMSATAYTAGYESTGKKPGDRGYGITASGLEVRDGIVAVDPDVIPLGTELYVEGYGFALAADTGGAIDGNKIDLFYHSIKDANKFGRKKLTVYVLE